MENNLGQGKNLKDDIIDSLSVEEKSIAGIIKFLQEKGNKVHRLVLTGYLGAMVDFGYLREKNLKPSRIFSYDPPASQDVYRAIGNLARTIDEESSGDACLSILFFILGRPVFMREIERCNVDLPREYKQANSNNRTKYLEMLQKKGIRVPINNPMIEPKNPNSLQVYQFIRQFVIEQYDLKKLVDEENAGKQKTLDQE